MASFSKTLIELILLLLLLLLFFRPPRVPFIRPKFVHRPLREKFKSSPNKRSFSFFRDIKIFLRENRVERENCHIASIDLRLYLLFVRRNSQP